MAEPLFNEHPLQDYLRQSGDIFEPMPGAMPGIPDPFSEECADTDSDSTDLNLWSWLPTPALRLFQVFNVTSAQNHHSPLREFSDKFQYDVISSSLLSTSITAPSSTRRRSSSSASHSHPDDPDLKPRTKPSRPVPSRPVEHHSAVGSLTLFCLCCISLSFDLLCVLIGTAFYYVESHTVQPRNLPDYITPTLGYLNDLISAANLWDSAVHEAINLLELEESMSPSLSPSSPLRVALHSSLQSTQVQSDNVRHVLVGLTAPSALARLSEMYAPPSPMKPLATLHSRSGSATAGSRTRASSPLSSDKRATWNGSSYAALANAGSPSRRSLKRWEKRRSDLSTLLLRPNGASMSAPTTPKPRESLNGVEEEGGDDPAAGCLSEQEGDADAVVPLSERGQFASAALKFQRQRRSRGIEAFFPSTHSPPPKYTAISSQPPTPTHITRLGYGSSPNPCQSPPPSSYSASRFTAMQTPRHPLSLYSLTLTLNGALAARRYAASHLLALRFDGADDSGRGGESYWDDVRAVMALLTSALTNATAPLVEALEAAEHERLLTENPSPTTAHSRASSTESHTRPSSFHQRSARRKSHVTSSFAPLPSHLSRFAAHVDALMNALYDAREHLESCVASLRGGAATGNAQDAPALRAYECLRRELGLALRECERGREPLLELLLPPRADSEDEDDEEVPALGPDAESSDSDKDASSRAALSPLSSPTHAVLVDARPADNEEDDDDASAAAAAAAAHERGVLVVGLEHLPAPGIEQVFEAADVDVSPDADVDRLVRPRSKLSRAERIAAAKARRATTGGLGLLVGGQGDRDDAEAVQWAPVGEVVQELKDVIWKVGEQRRMREQRQRADGEELDRAARADDVFTCPTT